MHTDPTPHLFWITSRAAGIVALILSSVSVCIGLLMGRRFKRVSGPDLRVTHEALSLATLAALMVHGLALLGDGFLSLSLSDVAVPFASSYKTFWTSTGIIAFWALALLGVSYYARRWVGVKRWRKLHRFTALAWLLGARPLARRGNRRRPDLVPGDDGDRRWSRRSRCCSCAWRRPAGQPAPRPPAVPATAGPAPSRSRPQLPARGAVPPRRTPARTLL